MKYLIPSFCLVLGLFAPASLEAQSAPAANNAPPSGSAPAATDTPSLPNEITVTQETNVIVKQNDGSTGSALIPKGAKFRPTGMDGDKLTVQLQNGVAEIDKSATNYAEMSAQLNQQAQSGEAAMGETVDLNVKVAKNIPGGFLSEQRRIDGGVVQERIAVIGLPDSQLQEGEWWSGSARKLGKYSPDDGKTVYEQYQTSAKFGVKIDPPPGNKPGAPEVTYDEMRQYYESLNTGQWLTLTNGITKNIPTDGISRISADQMISLGVKKEQIDYIGGSIPKWNQAAQTAKDWIDNRNMPETYKKLLQLVIKANSLLGPGSIGTMRNYVKQIENQWKTIEAIDAPSPVAEDEPENITP
ncbi:MAG: hypothetical protein AAGK14_00935 [Verrucomicrobiota bacterium]